MLNKYNFIFENCLGKFFRLSVDEGCSPSISLIICILL